MYDPDCSTFWCDKCGRELTLCGKECETGVVVLRCQGSIGNRDGCGEDYRFYGALEERLPLKSRNYE